MTSTTPLTSATVALALVSALTTGCGEPPHGPPAPPSGPAQVGVMVVQRQQVALVTELPGRTVPYQIAEVRPQVTGLIQTRNFQEGSLVKAGQPLYQIDAAS